MSKTLHQFGRVLFAELEQIAVRRGGFASLEWVNEKLLDALRGVKELREKAADPNVDLSSGCDLRLMSPVKEVSDIPTEGNDLIIVAAVDNLLHFRMFDGDGKVVVETDEKRLTKQARQIDHLSKQLLGLWLPHELTGSEKDRVITAVSSIVGHTVPSLRKRADKCARQARDSLVLTSQTAEAVERLGQIISDMVKTAQEVQKKIKPPDQAPAYPFPVKSFADLIRDVFDKFRRTWLRKPWDERAKTLLARVLRADRREPEQLKPWDERVKDVESRFSQYAVSLQEAQKTLRAQGIRDQSEKVIHEARFERTCRVAWGLKDLEHFRRGDRSVAEAAREAFLKVARESSNTPDINEQVSINEQVTRGALVLRSDDLASALESAIHEFAKFREAFKTMAKVKKGPVVELLRMVSEQPAASRYEIYDVIEDAARQSAMRMGTVGLAFSGGGIRSATFNLGFLQGAATLGLLKQFDYLSTVSGGGYIGAWFAAWVLREGGHGRERAEPRVERQVKTARARLAALLRREGGRAGDPEPPTGADVKRELSAPTAEEEKKINDEAGKTREPVCDRQTTGPPPKDSQAKAEENVEKRYQADVDAKRQRTSQALENVQKQLNSSRARQARAVRRWVQPTTIRDGREATVLPPHLERTVEEEPAPVYHLRAHSNYLAPETGLLSINTWTMVSVYFRNLFLNQFILLPMMLAVIAVPRLWLLLFTHRTSDRMMTLARGWLARHDSWPGLAVLLAASLVSITWPVFVDSRGRWIVGWVRERIARLAMLALLGLGMTAGAIDITRCIAWLIPPNRQGTIPTLVRSLARDPLTTGLMVLLPLVLAAAIGYRGLAKLEKWAAEKGDERARGWAILWLLVLLIAVLVGRLLAAILHLTELLFGWITGDGALFLITVAMACVGFYWTYLTVAEYRLSHGPAPDDPADQTGRFDPTKSILWWRIVGPLTMVSFGVSLLFARPGKPFFVCPLGSLSGWFDPAQWDEMKYMAAVWFGVLVGSIRAALSVCIHKQARYRNCWKAFEWEGRALSAFSSGLISGAGLAAVLSWLSRLGAALPGGPGAVMMSFGPALVMIAFGAGSAIEVGLIGGYSEEDMREWRASLGAYLLIIGTLWAVLSVLSVYGPLFLWRAGRWAAWAAGAVWVITSFLGALAGRSERTDGVKTSKSPLEYVAAIAPPVFIIGLVVAVSVLVAAMQGVDIPIRGGDEFLRELSQAGAERTWIVTLLSAYLATVTCVHLNINLFGLNAFYANRLVRCYLGASRPREAPAEERPNFAPTNSAGAVRRPNPITGFDPDDDFPLRDLAIVRSWDRDDVVVDYRGPYHLINTAMNLVAGSELAWQERMAESFILSPLYCGSKTTGYRPATSIVRSDLEDNEVKLAEMELKGSDVVAGYGNDIRLGTAISVSGAAASPNAGYHSSPLVAFLMTVLNARLGLWLGNPARSKWRRSGPEYAFYLLGELFSRTTSKERYVYLSDGGHFENLGAYELVRRRCRYIVVCDAGADPGLSFWDLGSLVRKCRQDFGVRIEIDTSPLLRKEGTPHAKWHCAVGQIHYNEVDVGALPGTLIYIKPSLSGDEPSDVRNYVIDHPTFPHESTADQFFSESRFESYRELGEHIALDVFRDAVRDAGPDSDPATLFSRLRRRWAQAPPNLDKNFLESVKPFVKIHEALRTDPRLESLSHELYPKLGEPSGDGVGPEAAPSTGDDRAHVHAVIEMLQAMENAWIAVNLDAYSDHPLNRGWMNVFRRWISSGIFHAHWPAVRGEFSEGFVRFCESELNLTVQEPKVAWLEGAPDKADRMKISLSEFNEGLRELDKEFSLEWPHLVLHEIGDGRSGLGDMFQHARKHPPVPGKWPVAVLIRPGETAYDGRPTSEPSYYGVILAWGSSDGVVELVVWMRGAYRTLGLGGAIKKALNEFKKELETLDPFKTKGYTLRTRYQSDDRSKGKQRWQRTLWTEFFQNQGFHRDGSDTLGNDQDTLIYRWEPR